MRNVYVCLSCAGVYLPPEDMVYPTLNLAASPVHCSAPACASAVEPILAGIGVPEETVALWARRAAGVGGEPRRGRSGRMARGRRGAPGPASARSKLL